MAMLLLDRAQLEVKSEGETLALYEAGQRRGSVPIKLIDRCVIHGAQTRLDSGVLIKLAEAGVTTLLMSPRSPRRVALVLGTQHNDAAVRLAQSQRVMNDAACRQWAQALVRAKLQRQLRTLRVMQAARPDARKPLFDAINTVQTILTQLPASAATAPQSAINTEAAPAYSTGATGQFDVKHIALPTLLGLEGAAARAYFAGLAGVFAPALGFSGRNRRPPRDPVNVCLSLSYTMAHMQAVQSCISAGLDPLLGFYHRPSFGRESLASDLIEPLRPAIDLWVWQNLLRHGPLTADHFSLDKGACILGKTGRQIYYRQWEDDSKPWARWLRNQTQALARTLRAQGELWLASPDEDDEAC